MRIWRELTIWAVSFCSKAGDGMKYFYDYFAKKYRVNRKDKLFPAPTAMFRGIRPVDVKNCRGVLKKSFDGCRDGRKTEVLKRLFGEYRQYVSGCYNEQAKERYNAFVYRYMLGTHVGSRAIAVKLGVTRETVHNYINRCIAEMLMLCMGMPAAVDYPKSREEIVCMLLRCHRLFNGMAGDYVLSLFDGKGEKAAVEQGRQLTRVIMERFAEAVGAYSEYCNDEHTRIDTDIRKADILEKCLVGVPPAVIAREYGCCESTVYADIRENERRLGAMLFDV